MSPTSSSTQSAINNRRPQNQQSQRGRQQTLPQQTVERQQTQQQQTAQRQGGQQANNEQRSKPSQQQGQSQVTRTQSGQAAIQQQNPKQQQQQHQKENRAPSTAQRRSQQASRLAFRSQTEPDVIPTKQRIMNDQGQNLVQEKTKKKAVADTIRSSVSLSSFPGKEGTRMLLQYICLDRLCVCLVFNLLTHFLLFSF